MAYQAHFDTLGDLLDENGRNTVEHDRRRHKEAMRRQLRAGKEQS